MSMVNGERRSKSAIVVPLTKGSSVAANVARRSFRDIVPMVLHVVMISSMKVSLLAFSYARKSPLYWCQIATDKRVPCHWEESARQEGKD